ncbi:VapC toxin family PIN domain ribonuclease [Halovibrio salipaludis]|uniref:Ribonuclease VapC n=1 Tax=Halovibrio salipaludis TaxID=2032626 RepID=A0A2A2EZR8_9GAMM|nr:type II toxin-antitoxin system VapC family toxin [Halovibrio salipaludis]PAU77869.1 VapC toxin family PIN domain ribonuclease [Halovibrio salipaludis]
MIVLDTNVISELMRPAPDERVVQWLDLQSPENVAVTAITVAEILFGIERLPEGKRRTTFAEAAASLFETEFSGRILPFDSHSAGFYAMEVATAESQGKTVSMADAQIAGVCMSNDAALATRNIRDFEAFPLNLINPWMDG